MRNDPQAVMLFAAGFGKRMGKLTADRPKPLVPVAGRPLVDHALDLVSDAGIVRMVVNLHYKAELLAAHLSSRNIALSHETPDILETGGGLRHALPLLGREPVFTLNTDAIWKGPNPLVLAQSAWDPDRMDALLVCIPPHMAVGHAGAGDFSQVVDGQLIRGPGLIYGGAQIIKTDRLANIPEKVFSLNVVWNKILSDGKLFGISYPGQWCDVGHPEGILLAEQMIGYKDV